MNAVLGFPLTQRCVWVCVGVCGRALYLRGTWVFFSPQNKVCKVNLHNSEDALAVSLFYGHCVPGSTGVRERPLMRSGNVMKE